MNNKLLALILIFSVTIVNFNNCADKAKEEAQIKQDNLAELIKEFNDLNDLKEHAENAGLIHGNTIKPNDFKKFKERVLSLFDKFNNESLKQKVGSVKDYKEGLIKAGLYPQGKINLEGPIAIKVFEDGLQDQFYNLLKSYFSNIVSDVISGTTLLGDFIQIFPIQIGNKALVISDFFEPGLDDSRSLVIDYIVDHQTKASANEILTFLVAAASKKSLNEPILDGPRVTDKATNRVSKEAPKKVTLLIYLTLSYIEILRMYKKGLSSSKNKIKRLANVIKALLLLPEIDIAAKDSKGLNFADYANEKDGNGYINPELHQIYEEHMAYITQRQDALKEGLADGFPASALRDLAAGYVS